jgi:hypothetical protein
MNKRTFIELLRRLNLPHPPTRTVRQRTELDEPRQYPYSIKDCAQVWPPGVYRSTVNPRWTSVSIVFLVIYEGLSFHEEIIFYF